MPADVPRSEHPRPEFVRPLWANLNGAWRFAFDPDNVGVKQGWFENGKLRGKVRVPFAPESSLSGIGDPGFHSVVWYGRTVDIPRGWRGQRVLLHFGAVDYACRVWLNGKEIAKHRGGYTPFSMDLTGRLRPRGNYLAVRAEDRARGSAQPRGKQSNKLKSYQCLYTRTTGIWQTVWLEAVGDAYLKRTTRVQACFADKKLLVRPDVGGVDGNGLVVRVELLDGLKRLAWGEGPANTEIEVPVKKRKPWGPGSPRLYTVRLTLRKGKRVVDRVRSYCGFRDITIEGSKILLNGRPLYQKLVLDQRYYPDGVYTAPTDRAIKRDIRRAMAAGFNGARVHQKVADPRYYYWADRLGFLLWGEMADWGMDLSSARNRKTFEREWTAAVRRDWNHPSIIAWTPFNERRGPFCEDTDQQDFVAHIHDLNREIDPTRPAIDNDGYCHVKTDIATIHDYSMPEDLAKRWRQFGVTGEKPSFPTKAHQPHYVPGRRYGGEPVVLSEVAGVWYAPQADHEGWGYGERPASLAEYVRRYRDTIWAIMALPEIRGFCVTQLTDVEQEQNGIYYYDRSTKVPADVFSAIHAGPKKWQRHPGAKALRKALGE